MLIYFKWLLLFCPVFYRGTSLVGTILIHVTGKKGDSVTLPCQFKAKEVSQIVLNSVSEKITVCKNEECDIGRAFKAGDCDVILTDLRLTDAGKYIMKVYYKNSTALEQLIRIYQLHIHDEVSVKAGEELKLDVLLPFVNKIEHETHSSTEWTEIWSRSDGLQSDRLTISNGNLTISHFTANDAGTYRVLDTDGQTMITLRLTESKGTQDKTDEGKSDETSQLTVLRLTAIVGLILFPVLLVGTLIYSFNQGRQVSENNLRGEKLIWERVLVKSP